MPEGAVYCRDYLDDGVLDWYVSGNCSRIPRNKPFGRNDFRRDPAWGFKGDRSGIYVFFGNPAVLLGCSRYVAAEFSFFLAVPVMFGASLMKLLKFGLTFTSAELVILLIGMATAFLVSLVVIRFLMGYIKKHDFKVFGWYRIALGALVLLYFTWRG